MNWMVRIAPAAGATWVSACITTAGRPMAPWLSWVSMVGVKRHMCATARQVIPRRAVAAVRTHP
jgi:hypothetical protein